MGPAWVNTTPLMHWGFHLCCCQSHLPQLQALEREAQGQHGEDTARAKMARTLRHFPGSIHREGTELGTVTDKELRLGEGKEQDPLRQSQDSNPIL